MCHTCRLTRRGNSDARVRHCVSVVSDVPRRSCSPNVEKMGYVAVGDNVLKRAISLWRVALGSMSGYWRQRAAVTIV